MLYKVNPITTEEIEAASSFMNKIKVWSGPGSRDDTLEG